MASSRGPCAQADAAVPQAQKVPGGQIAAPDVVDVDVVDGVGVHEVVDDDDGHLVLPDEGEEFSRLAVHEGGGGDGDNGVHIALDKQLQILVVPLIQAVGIAQHQPVSALIAVLLHQLGQIGVEGVADVGDQEAEGVGFLGFQGAGGLVGGVVHIPGCADDALLGRLGHAAGLAVEHQGHGGDRYAGGLRDALESRFHLTITSCIVYLAYIIQ